MRTIRLRSRDKSRLLTRSKCDSFHRSEAVCCLFENEKENEK